MIYPHNSMPRGETGIPSTHWIMMGLNNPGGYDDNDAHFSIGLKNDDKSNQEIKEANIQIIKERIQNYGFTGMIDHLKQKINYTWSDGTYFSIRKLIREPLMENNPYADYMIGHQNKYFIYFSQISHITLIGLMLIGAFRLLRKKDTIRIHFNHHNHRCIFIPIIVGNTLKIFSLISSNLLSFSSLRNSNFKRM